MGSRNSCHKVIPHKISIRNRDQLNRYFLKEDPFVALSSMQNGKLRGLDVLPCKFYTAMWETVGDDLCCLVLEAFSSRVLTKSLNQGSSKTRDTIVGWRPITLLNVAYKILNKSMVLCVDDYSCVRHPPGHRLSESACERAHELGVPMRWVCGSSLRWRWNIVCPCVGNMPMSWECRSL
jgi:hypothetical protein